MFTLVLLACLTGDPGHTCFVLNSKSPFPTMDACKIDAVEEIKGIESDGKLIVKPESVACLDEEQMKVYSKNIQEGIAAGVLGKAPDAPKSNNSSPIPNTDKTIPGLKPLTPEQKSQGFQQI